MHDCGVLLRKNPHQLLLQSIPLLFLLPGQYQIQGDGRIQGNRNDPSMLEKFKVAFGDETNRFSLCHCADNGFYPGSTDDLGMDPLPVKFLHTAVVYACVRMHEDERFFRDLAQSNAGLVIEISGRMSAGEDRYQLVPGQKICLEIFILYQFLADYDEIVFPIFYAFQKFLFFCFIKDDSCIWVEITERFQAGCQALLSYDRQCADTQNLFRCGAAGSHPAAHPVILPD